MGGLFLQALFILFISLKITGHIDWSWFWVLSPLLIPLGIFYMAITLAIIGNKSQASKVWTETAKTRNERKGRFAFWYALTLCFIGLQLTGVIAWPLTGVLAPLSIPLSFVLLDFILLDQKKPGQ